MKPFTISVAVFCVLLLIYRYKTILDNQRVHPRFKTEYKLEVINSDSIKVLTSNNNVVFCKFNELQEVITKDNQ